MFVGFNVYRETFVPGVDRKHSSFSEWFPHLQCFFTTPISCTQCESVFYHHTNIMTFCKHVVVCLSIHASPLKRSFWGKWNGLAYISSARSIVSSHASVVAEKLMWIGKTAEKGFHFIRVTLQNWVKKCRLESFLHHPPCASISEKWFYFPNGATLSRSVW